jgi:hypothetical protein
MVSPPRSENMETSKSPRFKRTSTSLKTSSPYGSAIPSIGSPQTQASSQKGVVLQYTLYKLIEQTF